MSTSTSVEDPSRIYVVRVFEPAECSGLIAEAERLGAWKAAISYKDRSQSAEVNKDIRDHTVLLENDAPRLFRPYREKIAARFEKYLDTRRKEFYIFSIFVMNRYDVGEFFHVHVDRLPTHHSYRRYSFVCYLNDEFEDGGTAFPGIGRTYRPNAGQALLFPSHYLHSGEKVSTGRKYVLVSFLCDPRAAYLDNFYNPDSEE